MTQETKECFQVSAILAFFGGLIVYGGWYLIGGVALSGAVVVALLPLFLSQKYMDRVLGFLGSGEPGPIPWYASPLPYIILAGFWVFFYVYAT